MGIMGSNDYLELLHQGNHGIMGSNDCVVSLDKRIMRSWDPGNIGSMDHAEPWDHGVVRLYRIKLEKCFQKKTIVAFTNSTVFILDFNI